MGRSVSGKKKMFKKYASTGEHGTFWELHVILIWLYRPDHTGPHTPCLRNWTSFREVILN